MTSRKIMGCNVVPEKELDEYFAARNRKLTEAAMNGGRLPRPASEPPQKTGPVELAELLFSKRVEKDYGTHKMAYEQPPGAFRKRPSGSSSWGAASPAEIAAFKADVKAAAANNPDIAGFIKTDPNFA